MDKRILIFGHAGRGKTTFARKLSEKLSIPHYSTDDFFYKVKFTELRDREESVVLIKKVYDTDTWIVEGTTSRLLRPGLERAEVVFVLKHKSILTQYYSIIKRAVVDEKGRSISGTFHLLKHVTKKRYMKGYGTNQPTAEELKEVHNKKVIELHSFKEIDAYLASVK